MVRKPTSVGEAKTNAFRKYFQYDPNAGFLERAIKEAGDFTLGDGYADGANLVDYVRGDLMGDPRFQRERSFDDPNDVPTFLPFLRPVKAVKKVLKSPVKSALGSGAVATGVQGMRDFANATQKGLEETRDNTQANREAFQQQKEEIQGRSDMFDRDFVADSFQRDYKDVQKLRNALQDARKAGGLTPFEERAYKDEINKAMRHNREVDRIGDIMDGGAMTRAGRAYNQVTGDTRRNFNDLSPREQVDFVRQFNLNTFRDEQGNLPVPKAPLFARQETARMREEDRTNAPIMTQQLADRLADQGQLPPSVRTFENPVAGEGELGNKGFYTLGSSKARINEDGTSTVFGPNSAPRQFDDNIIERSIFADQSLPEYVDHVGSNTGVNPMTNTRIDPRAFESGLTEDDLSQTPKFESYDDYFDRSNFDDPDTLLTSRLNNQVG